MAKVRPSPLIDSISGKVGNVTFGNWRGQAYVRSLPVVVQNPNSFAQKNARNRFLFGVKGWRELPIEERALWNSWAESQGSASKALSKTGMDMIIPAGGTLQSGFNAYIGVNAKLLSALFATRDLPPQGVIDTEILSISNVDFDTDPLTITVAGSDDTTLQGKAIRLWVKHNRPGGLTYLVGRRIITSGDYTGPGDTLRYTFDFDTIRVGHGGLIEEINVLGISGDVLQFQVDMVSPSGHFSSPSNLVTGVVDL